MKSKILKVDDEIELRGCDEEYVSAIFSIVNQQRSYLREWLPWVDVTKKEENTRDYMKSAHQLNMGGQQLNTWIFYQNRLCGAISFVRIDRVNNEGEIGYWLSKEVMGNGIMTKSCKRMIRYGFEQMGLNRIIIRVAAENQPSLAIPERLGLYFEGVMRKGLRIREAYHDLHLYSILRDEFGLK